MIGRHFNNNAYIFIGPHNKCSELHPFTVYVLLVTCIHVYYTNAYRNDHPWNEFTSTPKAPFLERVRNFIESRFHSIGTTTPATYPRRVSGWRKGSWGYVPPGAFVGARLRNGNIMYVARTLDGKDVLPGYLMEGCQCIRYSSTFYWGRCKRTYEVLVGDSYTWYKGYNVSEAHANGHVHPDAIEGGYIHLSSGVVVQQFICRAYYGILLKIGRLRLDSENALACAVYQDGRSRYVYEYDTLIDAM